MRARSQADLDKLRKQIGGVRRVSDRLIGIGPFGIGLDGLSSWLPVAGWVYSVVAGAILMGQAYRAHASTETMGKMAGLLTVDALTDVVPIPVIAPLVDMAFTGHKWSANMLLKEMDRTVYVDVSEDELHQRPEYADLAARIRRGQETRRVVYLKRSSQPPATGNSPIVR